MSDVSNPSRWSLSDREIDFEDLPPVDRVKVRRDTNDLLVYWDEDSLFDREDYRTFQDAIDVWGADLQLDLAEEEAAELILASKHLKRDKVEVGDLVDELADIRIMYEQLAMFYGRDRVEQRVEEKMNRLRERLNEVKHDE